MRTLLYGIVLCLLAVASASAQQSRYAVELATFAEPVKDGHFKDMTDVYETLDNNYIYRYYIDAPSFEAADRLRRTAETKGFIHARVIDFEAMRQQCSITCQYVPPTATGNEIAPFVPVEEEVITLPSLHAIFFDYDKSNLRPDAQFELRRLAKFLVQNPNYTVVVSGHTDDHASVEYNDALAKRRADSAADYLENSGIAMDRIVERAYSELDPIAINEYDNGVDSPRGRQYNRRVEFRVLDENGTVLGIVNKIRVPDSLKKD